MARNILKNMEIHGYSLIIFSRHKGQQLLTKTLLSKKYPKTLSPILLRGIDMVGDILTTVYQELMESNLHTTQRILVSSGYDAITRNPPSLVYIRHGCFQKNASVRC